MYINLTLGITGYKLFRIVTVKRNYTIFGNKIMYYKVFEKFRYTQRNGVIKRNCLPLHIQR